MGDDKRKVFRVVNGKLERIPGDKRDPNRRYSAVSTPEGNYDLEFTEEEEKARDLEEKQWELDKPRREAEQKLEQEKIEKEYKDFKDSLIYTDRYIAFLDVLGWSALINTSIENLEVRQKMGVLIFNLQKQCNFNKKVSKYSLHDTQITQFSDCIVISINTGEARPFIELLQTVKFTIQQFMNLGFLVRGAITRGKLIHNNDVIFGPALNEAYRLERDCAIFPRVIFDRLFILQNTGNLFLDVDGNSIGYDKIWRQDKDGMFFLDYLQPLITAPGTQFNTKEIESKLDQTKTLIIENMEKFKYNSKIYMKYAWHAGYHNQIIDEYNLNVEKIIL